MYYINKFSDHLRIEFQDNFNYTTMKAIIHHVTMLKEYPHTNDIWLIGKHHADIRLGEVETMVKEFHCRCPQRVTRTKTAVVVEQRFTQTILELWINAIQKKVDFDLCIFQSLEDAESWLGLAEAKVA